MKYSFYKREGGNTLGGILWPKLQGLGKLKPFFNYGSTILVIFSVCSALALKSSGRSYLKCRFLAESLPPESESLQWGLGHLCFKLISLVIFLKIIKY